MIVGVELYFSPIAYCTRDRDHFATMRVEFHVQNQPTWGKFIIISENLQKTPFTLHITPIQYLHYTSLVIFYKKLVLASSTKFAPLLIIFQFEYVLKIVFVCSIFQPTLFFFFFFFSFFLFHQLTVVEKDHVSDP